MKTHQQTVEEYMHKHSQAADDQVQQVVEELHVKDHGLVTPGEGTSVSHKAHQEDYFIANLHGEHKIPSCHNGCSQSITIY